MRYKKANIIMTYEYHNLGRTALGVLSLAHRLPQDYGKDYWLKYILCHFITKL
jgi:hypothetical protein